MKSWEVHNEVGTGGRERGQGAGESPKSRGEGIKRGESKGWRAAPLLTG